MKLGRVLSRQGRADEAEQSFRHALTLEGSSNGLAFAELGYVLRSKGAFFEARGALRQALKLIPDHERAQDALSDVERAMRYAQES